MNKEAAAIVREVRKRYASETTGCGDARLACDEILRRLRESEKKRRATKR